MILISACSASKKINTKDIGVMIDNASNSIRDKKRFVYLENGAFNTKPIGVIIINSGAKPSGVLLSPMSASFDGPIEELIKNIASHIGYSVRSYGERSGAINFVTVNRQNSTPYEIIEDGLLQTNGLVRLAIDQESRSFTARYKRPERSPVSHPEDTGL
jgi:defect-in-organelle-trafficking protein DotD